MRAWEREASRACAAPRPRPPTATSSVVDGWQRANRFAAASGAQDGSSARRQERWICSNCNDSPGATERTAVHHRFSRPAHNTHEPFAGSRTRKPCNPISGPGKKMTPEQQHAIPPSPCSLPLPTAPTTRESVSRSAASPIPSATNPARPTCRRSPAGPAQAGFARRRRRRTHGARASPARLWRSASATPTDTSG